MFTHAQWLDQSLFARRSLISRAHGVPQPIDVAGMLRLSTVAYNRHYRSGAGEAEA
jgi:hypothetical protein